VRDSHRAMITILRVAYSFSFCCRRPHRIQARRQEIKWGGGAFCKKMGKMGGGFLVKKWKIGGVFL